ncbi:hypothetical protein [Pseudoalteromonas pernae]|uniref:hypothetical protein n=1 Tax=Pseudoalteromonas pernae TaxID=3118054 RepID=UPI003242D5B8
MFDAISVTDNSGGIIFVVMFAANFALHILFALGVFKHARFGSVAGKTTWIVGPFMWFLATLVLGPFFAAVYWLIHHSSFGQFCTDDFDSPKYRRERLREQND